jgi:hypothetical protein
LVENQFKTLAKAYTGFQLIMLSNNEAQTMRTIILLSKSRSQEEKSQNDEKAVQKRKRTMETKSKSGERLRKGENKNLYYNDKGDGKLVENQFKTLTRAITGFQHVMLSNNEDYPKGTNEIYTKSEARNDQGEIINTVHKCSSIQPNIMANAYSGIEQVSSELEVDEERSTNIQIRESIEDLASIYMHYSLGNRWERIKLYTILQAEFKEILFNCKFSDHIRNLSKTRSGLISVIQLTNFKGYLKGDNNTIAISQENYLRDGERETTVP